MTRIETFTDAAFAFAVTLLVVSIDAIPASYAELLAALQGVPAFAVSFALMFMFWHGHHQWSRRYGMDDFPTIFLSALLVFLVMIYVYPLKMMSHGIVQTFALLLGFDSDVRFKIASGAELQGLFLVYGAGFVAMCGTLIGCYVHAYRAREVLQLNEIELYDTRIALVSWSVMAGVGMLSCALALILPGDDPLTLFGVSGWVYMVLPVIMPWLGVRAERNRPGIS